MTLKTITFKFDCPCGRPSYLREAYVDEARLPYIWKNAHYLMEQHVKEEGNVYDPTKLKIVQTDYQERRL